MFLKTPMSFSTQPFKFEDTVSHLKMLLGFFFFFFFFHIFFINLTVVCLCCGKKSNQQCLGKVCTSILLDAKGWGWRCFSNWKAKLSSRECPILAHLHFPCFPLTNCSPPVFRQYHNSKFSYNLCFNFFKC